MEFLSILAVGEEGGWISSIKYLTSLGGTAVMLAAGVLIWKGQLLLKREMDRATELLNREMAHAAETIKEMRIDRDFWKDAAMQTMLNTNRTLGVAEKATDATVKAIEKTK